MAARTGAFSRAFSRAWVAPLLVVLAFGCTKTMATIKLPKGVGSTEQIAFNVAPNTSVSFGVHASKYSYSGGNAIMLDGELLKGGAVVARMSCEGFDLEGGAGSGCGATHYNSSCAMKAPASGADTIRIATRMQNPNSSATFEGVEIRVEQ